MPPTSRSFAIFTTPQKGLYFTLPTANLCFNFLLVRLLITLLPILHFYYVSFAAILNFSGLQCENVYFFMRQPFIFSCKYGHTGQNLEMTLKNAA